MHKFENRYCVFIDIIGFRSRIRQLEASPDPGGLDRLLSCLNFMYEETVESAYRTDLPVYEETKDGLIERELGDPRLTYVSDCIIISTHRSPDGFKALCNKATKIWIDLLWDGYLCRGAVSGGPLIHQGHLIMGSAYMDAFELESKADVPRIVIDPSLDEVANVFPSEFPARPPTMERGDDNLLYLRYFPMQYYPPYVPTWTDFLLRARYNVQKGLENADAGVRSKYEHMRNELNFCIRTYRAMLEPILKVLP